MAADQPETHTLAEAEYEVRSYAAGLSGALAPGREITRLLAEYDRLKAENVELRRVVASAQPRAVYTDVTLDVEMPIIRSTDKPITRKVKRGE